VCDWGEGDGVYHFDVGLGVEGDAVSPFAFLSLEDSALRQQQRSVNRSREIFKREPLPLPARRSSYPRRLRVGYFSADFHDHATLFLLSGLLREHDAARFEVHAYSYGKRASGGWRQKAEEGVDRFFDVSDLSDDAIVDLARSHALDIAIDLKGHTQHTRSQLFQSRLAPVQINYLGYPGTMGAEFIDFLIADPVVVPKDQREFYSEKVIYLPHCYQPNDDMRSIAETTTTRSDFGLPEAGFVFCCFNNTYKISPREFDIWMRLLSQVDGSVLWLYKANQWAEQNLKREAERRGVAASRLVFADKLPHSEHLARHKHADLFVDTFNVNAHTTASDALWSGLPLVTKQGQQFAARVAASLLHAVDLPELVTTTEDEYEALILHLATHPKKLESIRQKLRKNRLRAPLFNTKRYTRNFEQGLRMAYDLYHNNNQPEDIWVQESET
ncbi:hypothetical protein HKCCSP123_17035, partial [Rhodobacterales bacterium HKCCSP123]|nr:hypothetical protein [Rhodobacterales bacterium HKCCSP123]